VKWLKVNTVLLLSAVLSFWVPLSQADTQFRVIVDASGSMLISDPDKLTSEALRLISNLAPEEEATLGIVTQDVKTDLEAIIELLLETPDSGDLAQGFDRHWILVTDGMVDISLDEEINKASRDRILNDLTKKLEENGIHLHTISMTGYTDKALLESLSLRTNATHTEVAIPEDLLATFDRIFAQASPSDELPFDGNHFVVDDAIDELTLVVFHENGIQPHVIKPNGKVLSLVDKTSSTVSASDHYTLITISKPDPGKWQIDNVDIERSSIRVITNLSAQATNISPIVFVNEMIYSTVGLFEKDTQIKDDKVLNLLAVSQTLVRLNGEKKETIFSHEMTKSSSQFKQRLAGISEPGNYELVSLIDGKTFSRQLSQSFTVHPAVDFSGETAGDNLIAFAAKPVNLKLNVLRSNMRLELTYSSGAVEIKEMSLIGQGYWEKIIPASPNDSVKVRAKLVGVTQTGLRFDYWTPYWSFAREGDGDAKVMLGEEVPVNILLTPTSSSNNDVMPVLVPPAISIVNEAEESEEGLPDRTLPLNPEKTAKQQEVSMSTTEWIMYAAFNLIGILALVGGVLLYRRIKKNKSIKGDDENDV